MRPFRERNPIAVGLVSIAVLTVGMLFAFSLDRLTFLRGVYLIEAEFSDAAGLTPENEVRVAGLKVGKVRDIRLAAGGESALGSGPRAQRPKEYDRVLVTMEIQDGVQLGQASTAEVKLKTLLGSKFVDIEPLGGRPFLEPGARIPLERTSIPFEIYQATNQTVEKVGSIDAEALNDAFRELAAVTEDPEGDFGRALEGLAEATSALSERDADLDALLRSADRLTEVLAARSGELGRIIDSSAELLGALSGRRDALREFVVASDRASEQLAGLLRDTRADLDPALRDLHTVLETVSANLGPLEAALRVLGPDGESFGRVFTHGTWGEVWLASALGAPLPVGCDFTNPATCLPTVFGAAGLPGLFEEVTR